MLDTVGFLGLGNMGGAMAERLADAGCPMIVFDPSARAVEPFAARGVTIAELPEVVANGASVVLACLPSQKVSLQVAEAVAGGSAVNVYVECSTLGRKTIRAIEQILRARGIGLVDCPVSGGPKGARAGTLTTIVSGSPEAVRMAEPVLRIIAGQKFVVGDEVGFAQTCKIVNNMISISGLLISSEAVVLGVKAGLDAQTLIDVINASTGRNSATLEKFPKSILPRTFDFGGPMSIGLKDLQLYLDEAAELGLPSWSAANALQMLQYGVNRVGGEEDFTAWIKCFEEIAGVEVKGRKTTKEASSHV